MHRLTPEIPAVLMPKNRKGCPCEELPKDAEELDVKFCMLYECSKLRRKGQAFRCLRWYVELKAKQHKRDVTFGHTTIRRRGATKGYHYRKL